MCKETAYVEDMWSMFHDIVDSLLVFKIFLSTYTQNLIISKNKRNEI